jgi:hypothetical protein
MKKKLYLYGFTLGDSPKECQPDKEIIYSALYQTKVKAKENMKHYMKMSGWPCGAIVRITIEKVKQ